jgi:DNA polymerase-3 subunit delta'|tara:strand:- start:52 stop:1062 length:1011 start_codon:yes stop_codon:yes gene_type:complete
VSQTAEKSFELIKSAHERGRLAHAFLVSGDLGCGKEELASRLISMVNGPSEGGGMDLFGEPVVEKILPLDEQEGGWVRIIRPRSKSRRISVREIRDLEHTLHLAAPKGETKVGVIVDADRMNEQAENAFLKTLEEPPDGTLLLLLSTRPQRLLATILSRCVQVKLTGGRALASDGGDELVASLNEVASRGFGGPIAALHMKSVFTNFLAVKKAEAEAAAKAAMKEEIATYRDGTDGIWLKEREDFHKAGAEADYLEARNRYLDIILAWLADLIRIKTGSGGLDFPDSAEHLEKIAEGESVFQIGKRLDALEKLRQTLETNASEPLALEVGFLRAFA